MAAATTHPHTRLPTRKYQREYLICQNMQGKLACVQETLKVWLRVRLARYLYNGCG